MLSDLIELGAAVSGVSVPGTAITKAGGTLAAWARPMPGGVISRPQLPAEALPGIAVKRLPMGMGSIELTVAAPLGTLAREPQRTFVPRILKIVTKTASVTCMVMLNGIRVADANQRLCSGGLPAEIFGAASTEVELAVDVCKQGSLMELDFEAVGLGVGESVGVSAVWLGDAAS